MPGIKLVYKTNGPEISCKKKIAVTVAAKRQEPALSRYFIDRLMFLLLPDNDSRNEF